MNDERQKAQKNVAAAASIYVKQQLLHTYAILAVGGLAPPSNSLVEPAFCQKSRSIYFDFSIHLFHV